MSKFVQQTILSVLILAQASLGFAKSSIRSETADASAFEGWSEAKGASFLSEQGSDNSTKNEELNRLLERAQRRFLNGSLVEARVEFERLASLALSADWNLIQRKAILLAHLRVVQLSESASEQTKYLEAAASFAVDLKPERSLVPPPILERFSQTQKRLDGRSIALSPRERFVGFKYLVLNGRKFDIATTHALRILPGLHRLTLRSDVFQSVTHTFTSAQILVFDPKRTAFVAGDCGKPEWNGDAPYPDVTVFFSPDCQYDFAGGRWTRLTDAERKPEGWANLSAPKIDPAHAWSELEKPKRSILKSGWFWVGVAGVVTASAVLIQRENARRNSGEPTVTPSTTYQY